MSYGIKVYHKGESSLKDLSYTSENNTLQIIKSGMCSLTTDGSGNGKVEIPHELNYNPSFMVFSKGTASYSFLDASTDANCFFPNIGTYNLWYAKNNYLHAYMDNQNLTIEAKGAANSTTYSFKYLIFTDSSTIATSKTVTDNTYGIKIAQPNKDLNGAEQYQIAFGSNAKTLQYDNNCLYTSTLTIPGIWASSLDDFEEEGTYVDFTHNLSYPPLFLAFFYSTRFPNGYYEIPFAAENGIDVICYNVASFCNKERIRISFWRTATYALGDNQQSFSEDETITIKLFIFSENLNLNYG